MRAGSRCGAEGGNGAWEERSSTEGKLEPRLGGQGGSGRGTQTGRLRRDKQVQHVVWLEQNKRNRMQRKYREVAEEGGGCGELGLVEWDLGTLKECCHLP